MSSPKIEPMKRIVPMVYAYITPEIDRHNGWSKIGYTEAQTVEERIKEQTHTADVAWELGWKRSAQYQDGSGEYFTDKPFQAFLTGKKGVEQEADKNNEWFHIEPKPALEYFYEFASRDYESDVSDEHLEYTLREEQDDAVVDTLAYFKKGGKEFLWNAKPRFGKTLSTYDLIRKMDADQKTPIKVLVVTNRPSIANSWADDFYKFIGWRGDICFVSSNDSVKDRPGVLSRDDYKRLINKKPKGEKPGMVAFESLQSLKGSIYFGGEFDKLKWISEIEFDLLVVDESQEGVDTEKTDRAFRNIKRKHTLYLSGTPFKALANGRFNKEQIYNWSYVDEQRSKRHFDGDGFNVYERLPELHMYTYQMSAMVEDQLQKGAIISDDGEVVEYAFDLNEFFSTKDSGSFNYEDSVSKFLDALTTQEKYPFSTEELRDELPHTLWLLNRVSSAKALAKMLREHPVFSEYEVILAAGDGRLDEDEEAQKSYDKVKKAISEHPKTITLSVGQLTVGVTVPEWSGVLMLSNMKSPSSYMQAAFRVQNPYEATIIKDGKPCRVRKDNAYVFDFDPARTLVIFDEFANNLYSGTAGGKGTAEDRKHNIKELLNFFPVIGEDEDGKMIEIDAQQVLSIPRRLKSIEVVRRGFMSNYLFQNVANVFHAPAAVTEIISKLTPVKKDGFDAAENARRSMEKVDTDEKGDVVVSDELVVGKTSEIFGKKVYKDLEKAMKPALCDLASESTSDKAIAGMRTVSKALKDSIEDEVITPALEHYQIKKSKAKRLAREISDRVDYEFRRLEGDYQQLVRMADSEYERKVSEADTSEQIERAESEHKQSLNEALGAFNQSVNEIASEIISSQPEEITRKIETMKAQEEKETVEDKVRAHLRGFSRSIPSFIMAYGDENLTLSNFDDYTEDDVFEEVTGISEEDFRFLRDGGEYFNEETGQKEHFEGHLFDETVFDDSIKEFLNKRDELANYFEENQAEDIFDYIPPQRTNQIFTPRWIVKNMVDNLEAENPGCYNDPEATFADLYMKSGLYITEIVKRLFNSKGLKKAYPDESDRIRHILSKQVYGMAPTRIIYLIAMNYIFGFDESLREKARSEELPNFAEADAAIAAKEGKLKELVDSIFGNSDVDDSNLQDDSSQDSGDWLLDRLIAADMIYVDGRDTGDALWVLGGGGLADFMSKLEKEGVVFKFDPSGSKALDGKAGWWIKGYPERKES